jgi:hypothetical protein
MCASCGRKTGLTWGKSLLTAIPVPLGLAAGFLVPSGEDKLLLWILGVAAMFILYAYWAMSGQATISAHEPGHHA